MNDLLYIAIAFVLLLLTWGLLIMCEVLQPEADKHAEEKSGGTV
jgi:hypothetical protein